MGSEVRTPPCLNTTGHSKRGRKVGTPFYLHDLLPVPARQQSSQQTSHVLAIFCRSGRVVTLQITLEPRCDEVSFVPDLHEAHFGVL